MANALTTEYVMARMGCDTTEREAAELVAVLAAEGVTTEADLLNVDDNTFFTLITRALERCGNRRVVTGGRCDKCGGAITENDGYAEIDGGKAYWCEACAMADGVELSRSV